MGNTESTTNSRNHPGLLGIIKPIFGQDLQPMTGESVTLSSLELFNDKHTTSPKKQLSIHDHSMDMVSKCIVYGYIRQIRPALFQTIIPDEVLKLILLNYQYKYPTPASFNDIQYSKYLQFNNRATVSKIIDDGYGSCLFGAPITDKICRKYTITIKFYSLYKGFMMGYTKNLRGVYFNEAIGRNTNKYNSVGIGVLIGENQLELYNNNTTKKLEYQYQTAFDRDSIFKMEFDFGRDRLTIYHKYERGQKISLNECKLLLPAFTLFHKDDSLKIVKWKRTAI